VTVTISWDFAATGEWIFRRVSVSRTKALTLKERKGDIMRSDLIFGALTHVNNRYELCQLASKATRKLHKPNTRLQDTTNEVLDRFKDTIPMDESGEAVVQKVQLQERRAA
jgi:predicted transcriptional regulator